MEAQAAQREKTQAARAGKRTLKKDKTVLVRAKVARMDTDSDSESEDQYELDKLNKIGAMGATARATPATNTTPLAAPTDLEELEKMLLEDPKDAKGKHDGDVF